MNEWSVQIIAVNPDGTVTLDFEEFLRVAANPFISFTAAEIGDKDNTINTVNKFVGRSIYDSTNNLPLWAAGTTPTGTWNDATGAVSITPS